MQTKFKSHVEELLFLWHQTQYTGFKLDYVLLRYGTKADADLVISIRPCYYTFNVV